MTPVAPVLRLRPPAPAASLSLEDICRHHAGQIARWAERLGGPGLDVDDAVQEVLLVVARRLDEFRGEAKVTTWLFRITARVVANQRRALRRRRDLLVLTQRANPGGSGASDGPAAELERREAARLFYAALEELADRHRQVLVLFELEELSTDEIARLIERPPATVRVWLHRARARFAVAWARHRKETEP